jgi:hypothetical protein
MSTKKYKKYNLKENIVKLKFLSFVLPIFLKWKIYKTKNPSFGHKFEFIDAKIFPSKGEVCEFIEIVNEAKVFLEEHGKKFFLLQWKKIENFSIKKSENFIRI